MNIKKLVYIGMRISKKGVLIYKYGLIVEGAILKELFFYSKILDQEIGSIMSCKFNSKGIESPELSNKIYNADKLTQDKWIEMDRMARKKYQMKKEIEKASNSLFDELVQELKQMIKDAPPENRPVLKYQLFKTLT
ncbi:hypothetical protein Phi17:1_gp22 [Cellulophaga phage phi17:1]|uniref:Uncharacterized protein n=1 Tax=Cellulophaga phage phi17:1 TaxID=1327980 RepID=S0A252_9CAUD|nr:hypothetical protein Phi17:1_gp22 [Cellulophaga phage phi17:1]AGO48298.1 hypothetical protein Phi17:1_gp22 [Cellulophaga phage phi17:1]